MRRSEPLFHTTMTAPNPDISLVIPVFNEVLNLETLAAEIVAAMASQGLTYEVLFIDDGSSDGSFELLCRLAKTEPRFRVLRLQRNSGQSAALAAGFRAARGPRLVTLDSDLQNDPADVPRLLAELEDCDLVSGVRAKRRDTWVRRVSSRVANRVRSRVVHDGITDVGCSLKAYRTELLRQIPYFNGMHRFLPALLQMEGARVREVAVRHRPRLHGVSKYNIRNRLFRSMVDLLAVRWLQSRWLDRRREQEIDPRTGEPIDPSA
jgi:dolichol-phosphate mannosyltransferase